MVTYFSLCLLVSSSLLMLIQPLVARMLLPHLGGSPSVWNTCMVFFQTGLLAGYGYAHLGPRWIGTRVHSLLHLGVLLVGLCFLPLTLAPPVEPPEWPALWMFSALLTGVAAPYVALASSGSIFQKWFSVITGREPYFLYVASNLGSFCGLIVYPLLVEPSLSLSQQASLWRGGFVLLILLTAAAAWLVWRAPIAAESTRSSAPAPSMGQVTRWVFLALVPSSLMLSVTYHLTSDLASIPLLWIVPFGLYLLTFALTFMTRPWIPHEIVARYLPIVILFVLFFLLSEATSPLVVVLAMHLLGFTWIALFCHGELARTRPAADQVTAFYFWIALGGVLGGAFNVLAAPLLFSSYLEYPLMIVAVGFLRPGPKPWPIHRDDFTRPAILTVCCLAFVALGRALGITPGPPAVVFMFGVVLLLSLFQTNPFRYGLTLVGILFASHFYPGVHGDSTERRRSFFGVHRVTKDGDLVKLVHGNTVHGVQSLTNPDEPLAYYHRRGPIGTILTQLKNDSRMNRVGLVGLGSGALAAYAQKGQQWTFFEIDPDVVALAKGHFHYLERSPAKLRFILGDARITLKRSHERFGILIIDAFGSDSIPTHLLTQEALEIYDQHLEPDGLLLFHISNRYLDLFPVLASLAEAGGWHSWGSRTEAWPLAEKDSEEGRLGSWWVVMARSKADIASLQLGPRWAQMSATPGVKPWSDDFSHLLQAVRWRDLFR